MASCVLTGYSKGMTGKKITKWGGHLITRKLADQLLLQGESQKGHSIKKVNSHKMGKKHWSRGQTNSTWDLPLG